MSRSKLIIIITASIMVVLVSMIVILRSFVFELLVINGHSMSPTLRHGDRILVDKLAYKSRKPGRGDIIAFRMEWRRIIVKRIVGLPGDFIEVRDGLLYRNGELITHEPYVTFYPQGLRRRSYRLNRVEDRHLFVMGDNRVLSVDSKDFGPISYEDIIGKALFIYFPPGRIGRLRPDQEGT